MVREVPWKIFVYIFWIKKWWCLDILLEKVSICPRKSNLYLLMGTRNTRNYILSKRGWIGIEWDFSLLYIIFMPWPFICCYLQPQLHLLLFDDPLMISRSSDLQCQNFYIKGVQEGRGKIDIQVLIWLLLVGLVYGGFVFRNTAQHKKTSYA